MNESKAKQEAQSTPVFPETPEGCLEVAAIALDSGNPTDAAVFIEAAKVRAYARRTDRIVGLASSLLDGAMAVLGGWLVDRSGTSGKP